MKMKAQEKTDVDGGDAMLLIPEDNYPVPGPDSLRESGGGGGGVEDIDDYDDDGACPREAQCRCHLSYSCDYRSVDIRWKTLTLLTPRNNQSGSSSGGGGSNNCVCRPSNCCHWHCSSSHEQLSSSRRGGRRKSISSSSSSSTSIPSSSSSPPSSSSSSTPSSSLLLQSTIVDGVEVDKSTCVRDQCPHCSTEEKNVVSYFCDLDWRRGKSRKNNNNNSLDIEDFSMTGTPTWRWEFTSRFHRFMARFSGRRRGVGRGRRAFNSYSGSSPWARMTSFLYVIFVVVTGCLHLHIADACSSRSTPKPRPPSPTLRPNITIQTYTCPYDYDAHYCLNGATCFTVKIGESILYNCECSDGYMGSRCEFKNLDGSYLPSKQRAMLEQAGITSGVAIMVVFVIIVCFYLYVRSRRKSDFRYPVDEVDMFVAQPRRPFSGIHSPHATAPQSCSPPQHPPSHHHPGGGGGGGGGRTTMSISFVKPTSPTTTPTTSPTTANVPSNILQSTSTKSTVLPRLCV